VDGAEALAEVGEEAGLAGVFLTHGVGLAMVCPTMVILIGNTGLLTPTIATTHGRAAYKPE
jgi:hypothetical protein